MFHLQNEGLRYNKTIEPCSSSHNPYQHVALDESSKFRFPSTREHYILPWEIMKVDLHQRDFKIFEFFLIQLLFQIDFFMAAVCDI